MLDFVETVAEATGLPVGIKSAVGNMEFWDHLVRDDGRGRRAASTSSTSTAARAGPAPRRWSSPTPSPTRSGWASPRSTAGSRRPGSTDDVTFIGAGKLGIPENAVVAFALGADMVNVGREAMLAIGCIQAQKCHTDHCPVGVATQNPRYTRGLDPTLKSVRLANYVRTLRRDLLKVSEAVGVVHPALITPDDVDVVDGHRTALGRCARSTATSPAGASSDRSCARRSPR